MAFTIIRHTVINDQAATQQTQVAGTSLDIGRGTGNALFLDDLHIALRHAVIEYVDGRYVLKDLDTTNGTYVRHRSIRMHPLADGDVVHIGSYTLLIRLPAGDAPLTVEVTRQGGEEVAPDTEPVSYLARYRLAESFFTKSRLTVAGLVIILGGIVTSLLLGNVSVGKKTWYATTLLSPGDVTQAHRFIGSQCEKCHTDVGHAPSATTCTTCHSGDLHHADQAFTPECVSCHREHRSDHKTLTAMGDQFCAQCHADLHTTQGPTQQFAAQIRGFDNGHPEFSVLVEGQDAQPSKRVKLSDKAALRDTTAIKLNHAVHLTPERMQKFGFKPLTCTNCHKMDEQGAYMAPIAYAEHCAQCHPLEFDERFPGQVVPHGNQPEVMQDFLKKNYTLRCLERSAEPPPSPQEGGGEAVVERRRPGLGSLTPREPQAAPAIPAATAATVLQCRDEGVREAQQRLYAGGKQSVCGLCHTLQEPAPGSQLPTVVQPEIPARWFAHSKFEHRAHIRATKFTSTAENKNACEICHRPDLAASKSTQTSDVLLPGIASCQECHSSAGGASAQCVTCHQYHERSAQKSF